MRFSPEASKRLHAAVPTWRYIAFPARRHGRRGQQTIVRRPNAWLLLAQTCERSASRRCVSTDGISGSRSWRGLGGLLLVEKALKLGATDNRSRANLDRFDAALANELIEQCSRDAEILRGFDDGEAGLN